MKTLYLFIALILFCIPSFSQELEVYAGPDYIIYNNGLNHDEHVQTEYNNNPGFSVGLAIDKINYDWLKLRFALQYTQYQGNLKASEVLLASETHEEINFSKSMISISVFPVNIVAFKNLNLNAGMEFSFLAHETYSGTGSRWVLNSTSTEYYKIEDKYSSYNKKSYFGFRGRIAYNLPISESLSITPQYLFYLGCSHEFDQLPDWTKTMRHSFFVGINKKF